METMMKSMFAVALGLGVALASPGTSYAQRGKTKAAPQRPARKPNTRTHAAPGADSLRQRTYPTKRRQTSMRGKPFRRTVRLEEMTDGLARVRYIPPGTRAPRTFSRRDRKNVSYYLLSHKVKPQRLARLVGRNIEVTLQPDIRGKLIILDYRLARR